MNSAYAIMKEKGIRHLPVLDERNSIVGILSDRDIQRAMDVKKVNGFQQLISISETKIVEDYMSWPVYLVSETTLVTRVAEELLDKKVSAFIVQDNLGRMKGIVTTDDLLKHFLENSKESDNIHIKNIVQYFTGPELA
jgi:acetoin utilization protein AcuB